MHLNPPSFPTRRSSDLIEARKLTREEVAAAYYIPPPLVGILDHATFSNIREQHKQLYQDTLGPWRSEEHTSELQSRPHLVCRLLLEKKKKVSKIWSLVN